jgi:hypothetical protein
MPPSHVANDDYEHEAAQQQLYLRAGRATLAHVVYSAETLPTGANDNVTMKKKSVTARELMQRLNIDPTFVARREREEQEREKQAAQWRQAEAPLVEELRAAGYQVTSAWDLVNTASPYPRALPILLKHLALGYPASVREGIARALAVRDARFAFPVLLHLYTSEQEQRVKDGLAVALAQTSDDNVIGDMIGLARDPRHGSSRVLLLSALQRSRDPLADATLRELGSDPELKTEVHRLLSNSRPR